MSNPNKRKGTSWETAIVEFFSLTELEEEAFQAKRTGSADADLSDIRLGPYGEWLIEAKDHQQIDLPAFLRQLEASKVRAQVLPFKAAVFVKNRRHSTGEGYAVRRIEDEKQLINYVMALEEIIRRRVGEDLAALGWDYAVPVKEMADDISGRALFTPDTTEGNENESA